MKIPFEWEEMNLQLTDASGNPCGPYRAKVFGGWIVAQDTYGDDGDIAATMVFIPDAWHKWEL